MKECRKSERNTKSCLFFSSQYKIFKDAGSGLVVMETAAFSEEIVMDAVNGSRDTVKFCYL